MQIKKILFFSLIFCCFLTRAQKITSQVSDKVSSTFKFHNNINKKTLFYFKTHKSFAISMNANLKKKASKTQNDFEQCLSSAVQYDIKTNIYLNKKIKFIFRTQITSVSMITSLGLSFKIK